MRRFIAMLLALISVFGIFMAHPTTVSAATSSDLADKLEPLLPIVCYANPSSGAKKINAYSNSGLTKQMSKYWINSFMEEIVITGITSNGKAVKVRFLDDYGNRINAYCKTDDILGLSKVSLKEFITTDSMTIYRMKSKSSVTKYGSVYDDSTGCWKLGRHSAIGSKNYELIVYKLSNTKKVHGISVKHKMGLVTREAYKSSVVEVSEKSVKKENDGSFNPVWPCKTSKYISTMYYYLTLKPDVHGTRSNQYNAFDIEGSYGEAIYAVEKGVVVERGYQGNGFGYYVVIEHHDSGLRSLYAHLKKAACVKVGDPVEKKQVIGYMGKSGNSTGVHLHFEMYDPADYTKVINPWTKYYQGKVSVTIGGNSYLANEKHMADDAYAAAWCKWLKKYCTENSNGDYVFKA